MSCFRCSRQVTKKNVFDQDYEEGLVKTGSLTNRKKKKPWISWSTPKKCVAEIVSVDVSMSGNLDPISKSHIFKLDKMNIVPSKKHRHPTRVNASYKAYTKRLGTVDEIIVENRKINHATRDDKQDKKHSSGKKVTNKNGSSSSPENKTPIAIDRADLSVKNQNKEALDSIIEMSVIVVILVLTLFWGKLCVIICTSAWFYMIPRLRTPVDSNVIVKDASKSAVPNLNSDEQKKKVVLEGLLQRNRRSTVIGLL